MYNAYGERKLKFMRATVAELDEMCREGGRRIGGQIVSGVPVDAALVDVRLGQEAPFTPDSHVLYLVYEHESFPLVLAGDVIPAIVLTLGNATQGDTYPVIVKHADGTVTGAIALRTAPGTGTPNTGIETPADGVEREVTLG